MTKSKLRFAILLSAPLTLAAGLAWAGGPLTPLGQWMKPNMGASLAGGDFGALQKNFDFLSGKAPSADFSQWSSFAKTGEAAAAKKDLAGVKAACKSCHDNYKEKYRKEFATRPFP